jgi:uncharacterized Tic20 family protein
LLGAASLLAINTPTPISPKKKTQEAMIAKQSNSSLNYQVQIKIKKFVNIDVTKNSIECMKKIDYCDLQFLFLVITCLACLNQFHLFYYFALAPPQNK